MAIVSMAFASSGCGSLLQRAANLEDDELYLERGEVFVTDAEYLAYAYEQAGYNDVTGDYDDEGRRSGDGFQSSFGYVPQSLRGRSMLRGYMSPYGAAGFGPNPYDPWGSNFSQGYGAYNPGFVDPYNTWGSAGMGGGWGTSGWGINPYAGGAWGMNPYAYQPYGGGLYGANPYGWGYGNVYGGNPGLGSWGYGDGIEGGTPVVVAQRTPIWASSAINSNAARGRLLTNKVGSEDSGVEEAKASRQPATIWRALDGSKGSKRNNARSTGNSGRSSWGQSSEPNRSTTRPASTRPASTRPTNTRPASNQNSSRGNSWSRPSTSGSSRGAGSSTRPSPSRSTGGGSSGRSGGGVSRSSGRGGHPSR